MSHLLAISLGPVQELISAARRTRDLWFGSYLLSEVSLAVARKVEEDGKLIFPAFSSADTVANVILAELNSPDPRSVAVKAKQAAQARWLEFANEARQVASAAIQPDVWDEQVRDVIEFYAAWVPRTADYPADRALLMRLLAGRKNCRDFLPAKGRAGVPKSSLDGQRESALRPRAQWPAEIRTRLRVHEGEQLDTVGLVKRTAGGDKSFPSVTRVAADPWIRGNAQCLHEVIKQCGRLGGGIVRRLDTREFPQFGAFPFEGDVLYLSRYYELQEESGAGADQLRPLQQAVNELKPKPEPYLAVLAADGDRMGAAISALSSPEAHREFSEALVRFASRVRAIVENCHGALIYAGGDDVLAFLPVDYCLDCARQLHDGFAGTLRNYGEQTLSVGVAIGHHMETLEDLLAYARAAERDAKEPDRNGLAVHLHKRSGAPVQVRAAWTENPEVQIMNYARLILAGAIPARLSYDLRQLADVYEGWPNEIARRAVWPDVLRVIRSKQPRSGSLHMDEIAGTLRQRVTNAEGLRRFEAELLVARQMASALDQAGA